MMSKKRTSILKNNENLEINTLNEIDENSNMNNQEYSSKKISNICHQNDIK